MPATTSHFNCITNSNTDKSQISAPHNKSFIAAQHIVTLLTSSKFATMIYDSCDRIIVTMYCNCKTYFNCNDILLITITPMYLDIVLDIVTTTYNVINFFTSQLQHQFLRSQ